MENKADRNADPSAWVVELQNLVSRKKDIYNKNKEFIQEKVEADSELKLARVESKLNLIVSILISNGVIDEKTKSIPSMNMGTDNSVIAYALKNKRFSAVIYIYTDGDHIVVRDSSFLVGFGGLNPYLFTASIEDVDAYNWISFSEKLLDYIYERMYNSKRVNELGVFGM